MTEIYRATLAISASGVDKGPKIAEHPVEVFLEDTEQDIFSRVQCVAKAALPYALDKFLREQRAYNGNS
jgi:folate-dependent phosphoribosylglycinamide formyltransferase PurN